MSLPAPSLCNTASCQVVTVTVLSCICISLPHPHLLLSHPASILQPQPHIHKFCLFHFGGAILVVTQKWHQFLRRTDNEDEDYYCKKRPVHGYFREQFVCSLRELLWVQVSIQKKIIAAASGWGICVISFSGFQFEAVGSDSERGGKKSRLPWKLCVRETAGQRQKQANQPASSELIRECEEEA